MKENNDAISSRIKEEIALHKIEAQYGFVVKFYHLFIFGKGDRWYFSVMWALINFVGLMAQIATQTDGFSILFYLSLMLEAMVNIHFGYHFTSEHQLTKMLYYYQTKYHTDTGLAIKYLNYGSILGFLYMIVVISLSCASIGVSYSTAETTATTMIINAFVIILCDFLIVGTSIYLCVVWCIQTFVMLLAFDSYFLKSLIKIEEISIPFDNETDQTLSLTTPHQTYLRQIKRSSMNNTRILSPFHQHGKMNDNDNAENNNDDQQEDIVEDKRSFINTFNTWKWLSGRRRSKRQHRSNFATILKREEEKDEENRHENENENENENKSNSSHKQQQHLLYLYDQQRIEKKIFFFLEELRDLSDYWQINHIVRTITGIVIVSNMAVGFYISIAIEPYNSFRAFMCLLVVIIYYALIWFTALSAGYVNDFIFGESITTLARLYSELSIIDEKIDQQIGQTMNKLTSLNGKDGMHYAGVTITMDIAISVGTLLASFLIFCINYFCSVNVYG